MTFQDFNSFVLKQRITPLINRYEYYAKDGGVEQPIAFVEQKRFKIKEEITAWTSSDKGEVVFTMKAEKVMDVHGKYLVTDAQGQLVGYLRKVFGKSLLRSTWEVYGADDSLLLTVQETSQAGALIRRFGGLIPFVGGLVEFWPFNFQFMAAGQQVGNYNRIMGIRDNYDVTLEPAAAQVDRRLVLALGIALDALQDR
jgi:uncharacterized protein YxjI